MTDRIWNGTVVRERERAWHGDNNRTPMKGVVISQTQDPDKVVVRWEGGNSGEWEERVSDLEVVDEKPVQDGTRAYSAEDEAMARAMDYDPSTFRDEDGPWGGGFARNH